MYYTVAPDVGKMTRSEFNAYMHSLRMQLLEHLGVRNG